MTDNELLDFAAKAAEVEIYRWQGDTPIAKDKIGNLAFGTFTWNPLTDDGDALRLAVKLHLDICVYKRDEYNPPCTIVSGYEEGGFANEPITNDPYATTRRAIVRAAAGIGKEMK